MSSRVVIEVRRMGSLEIWSGRRCRLADAYAVVVNGRVRYPWMQKRAAQREARALREEATS